MAAFLCSTTLDLNSHYLFCIDCYSWCYAQSRCHRLRGTWTAYRCFLIFHNRLHNALGSWSSLFLRARWWVGVDVLLSVLFILTHTRSEMRRREEPSSVWWFLMALSPRAPSAGHHSQRRSKDSYYVIESLSYFILKGFLFIILLCLTVWNILICSVPSV